MLILGYGEMDNGLVQDFVCSEILVIGGESCRVRGFVSGQSVWCEVLYLE